MAGNGMATDTSARMYQRLIPIALLLVVIAAVSAAAVAPIPTAVGMFGLVAVIIAVRYLRPFALSALVILTLCEAYFEIGGRTVRAETVLVFLLLAGLAISCVAENRRLRPSPIYLPLGVFVAVLCCSMLIGLRQPVAAEEKIVAVVNGTRIILAYLVFIAVLNYRAEPEKKLSAVISAVVLFSFVSCGIAALQILYHGGKLPFGLPSFLTETKLGGKYEVGREVFGPFIGETGAHEFARMLSLQALTVFSIAYVWRSPVKKFLAFSYVGVMVLILARISVRAALFGLFAGCCAILAFEHRTSFRKYVGIGVVGCCGLFVMNYFATHHFDNYWLQRIHYSVPLISTKGLKWQWGNTMLGRLEYWDIAWRMFQKQPLLGVGINMYGPLSVLYTTGQMIDHPHNGFIHVATEAGIIGSVVFVWLSIVTFRQILKLQRQPDRDRLVMAADTLLLAMPVWMLAVSVSGTVFLLPKDMMFFWILLGARCSPAFDGLASPPEEMS